jgi:hypothetical protein
MKTNLVTISLVQAQFIHSVDSLIARTYRPQNEIARPPKLTSVGTKLWARIFPSSGCLANSSWMLDLSRLLSNWH